MSSPLFKTDILFVQRLLSSCGLYKGPLDSKYNSSLQNAEDAFDEFYVDTQHEHDSFDLRSEGVIYTLLPKAQIAARKFLSIAHNDFKVGQVKLLSGTRTYAEQDVLFNKRPVVTKARGGYSNHNFGIAWDVGIFVGGNYYTGKNKTEDQAYIDLAKIIKPAMPELEWGGDWSSITDMPHYGLRTNKKISEVRALFEAGKAYV